MKSIVERRKIEHKNENIRFWITIITIMALGYSMNYIFNLSFRDIALVLGLPFLYGIIEIFQNIQDDKIMNQGE